MKTILACAAALGLAATAVPAAAQGVAVQYADLNLATKEGVERLERRIDAAARESCAAEFPTTGSRIASAQAKRCAEAAKADAMEKFAAVIERQRLGG